MTETTSASLGPRYVATWECSTGCNHYFEYGGHGRTGPNHYRCRHCGEVPKITYSRLPMRVSSPQRIDDCCAAGWSQPQYRRRWHYYEAGATKSICGQWYRNDEALIVPEQVPNGCKCCERILATRVPEETNDAAGG